MDTAARLMAIGMLTLFAAVPANAQDYGATIPRAPVQTISTSPLLTMFKWFNVDYERKMTPSVTLGVSGSYLPARVVPDYGRATFHVRYYPQGAALTGFYMGAQVGVHTPGTSRRHGLMYGAGTDFGYAWLLGPNQNHSVSIGFGTTRMFAGDVDRYAPTIPNARLVNIGFAF